MNAKKIDWLQPNEFTFLYDHIQSFTKHKNMHTRETRILQGERILLYLNINRVENNMILGCLAGPEIYMDYTITLYREKVNLNVVKWIGNDKYLNRVCSKLLHKLYGRAVDEIERTTFFNNRKPGNIYLTRSTPGMKISHPKAQQALRNDLPVDFLRKLETWGFRLDMP